MFIWILVGTIFLAKLARVRGLVARLRREPVPVQMAVVLVLCGAIIHASPKTNAPDATLSSAPRSCGTSSTTTTTPPWWRGDDTDTDGFDDWYELQDMPPAAGSNFDVVVDAYTSRSAVLTWTNSVGSGGIVLMATTGTDVKLRLPFGEDTQLQLLPAPEGVEPTSGELWKSGMRVSFAPRLGQSLNGNALMSFNGAIAHKVVNVGSKAKVFMPVAPEGGFSILSAGGDGGGDDPGTDINHVRLEIEPDYRVWHSVGDQIGSLNVVSDTGTEPVSVEWSADYAEVSEDTGDGVTVTVSPGSPAGEGDSITLTAVSALDAATGSFPLQSYNSYSRDPPHQHT